MKFIVEIDEKDVQGCYLCPFNYDTISCTAWSSMATDKKCMPDDIESALYDMDATSRPMSCPLVPIVADADEMKGNWPNTIGELLNECEQLSNSRDLYTLGEYGEPFDGEDEPRVDGTDYLAGEYQYGVAMIPAQWVTHVLKGAE